MMHRNRIARWLAAIAVALALATGSASAALPGLPEQQATAPVQEVLLDGIGTFNLHPGANGDKTLFVQPSTLPIARDEKGNPLVRVVLAKNSEGEGNAVTTQAWGYVLAVVHIGYDNRDLVFDKLRKKIATDRSLEKYRDYKLAAMTFKPGTGRVGFSVLPAPGQPPMITWLPDPAPTTVGGQLTMMVPITKEHGEIIRQRLMQSPNDASVSLGVSFHYKADVTFEAAPFSVVVECEKNVVYDYFHEQIKGGGGFFIFSFSAHKETIREKLEKDQKMITTVRFGTKELNEQIKHFGLKELVNSMKDRAIEFVADIEVDTENKVKPDAGYEKRVGHITIFSPSFFWSFSAWFGGSYGVVDVKKHATGKYREEMRFEGQVELPIALQHKNFELKRDMVVEVDLEKAFYMKDLAVCRDFNGDEALWGPNGLVAAKVVAKTEPGTQLAFYFSKSKTGEQVSNYWRDAVFFLDKDGVLRSKQPALKVQAELTTRGGVLKVPVAAYERSSDWYKPTAVELNKLFTPIKIDASLAFQAPELSGKPAIIQVKYIRPSGLQGGTDTFSLTANDAVGYTAVVRGDSLKGVMISARLVDGNKAGPWSEPRPAEELEVFITNNDLTPRK